jgi:hypothetical protein
MHPPRFYQPTISRCIRPALALSVLGACLTLAACGSSASSSTSTASTSSSSSSKSAQGPGSSRFAALRSCLAKQGITLPAPSANRPPAGAGATGQAGPPGGAGGFQLPKGVSRTQYQEAIKKCGGGSFAGAGRFNSATSKTALTKFVACMRENGVTLPTPNTSGNGPVFDTKGINTSSAAFKSAESKCRSDLGGAVGGGSPSGGPPGGGGGPPAGEGGGAPPSSESEPTGQP